MSSAIYKGWVALPSIAFADDQPVCTGALRTLASNVTWLWEQSAQVRVKWIAVGSSGIRYLSGDGSDAWRELLTWRFPTRVRPDGSAMLYRVRLAAFGDRKDSGTYGYRIAVGSSADNARAASRATTAGADCAELTGSTASAAAWLTLDKTVLTMPDLPQLTSVPSHDAIATASPVVTGADMFHAYVTVSTQCDQAGDVIDVVGIVVEEFAGTGSFLP